jgi:hypothetical protein
MTTLRARHWAGDEGWVCCAMRDELAHALHEAIYELDVLPEDESAALLALYAIMDDLRSALHRAQAMDAATAAV